MNDVRADIATEVEAANSPLCDCAEYDAPPMEGTRRLAHHCLCPAVVASQIIRKGQTPTRHAQECSFCATQEYRDPQA